MRRLLVVVDYQNDFVDGSLGFKGAELIDRPIAEKVRQYKKNGDTVIFTFDTHGSNYLELQEGRKLPVIHCQNGTRGWQLYGETAKEFDSGCISISKHAFGSYDLAEYVLRTGNYDEIEVCGLVSNICMASDAILIKAVQPEAEITIDARCTASNDPKLNEEVLDVLESMQFNVINR